jgi:hypothetical protein
MSMKRASFMAAAALWLAVIVPPAARAAGGPVSPIQDSYIGVPGVPYQFAAWNTGGATVVKVRRPGAGTAISGLRLAGHWGIPGVDYSGSTTGLSADGRTLILAEIPNGLPRTTRLLVLDTEPVVVRARIALPGWSTVDAISPDGRWLYLIHYASSNVSNYEVLAYDLIAHRLLPKPIIDPRDRDEAMTGFPVTRVMSAGGRWAYTLYFRPSGVPFIHALDTSGRRAVCVDLPSLSGADASNAHLRLGPGGTTLRVDTDSGTSAQINTRTFKVSPGAEPSAAAQTRPTAAPVRPVAHTSRRTRSQGDPPWEFVVLLLGALAVVAAVTQVLRSRSHSAYRHGPEGATITVIDPRLADRVPGDDEVPVA